MASYDSADLLLQFDELAGRPEADEITDLRKYARLARGQQDVIVDASPIVPTAFYRTGGPTATTTSGGIVHTFGSDGQGHAVAPLGHVWVGRSTARYPDIDLVEGVDYVNEGTQIRMVNERVEPALYWNGVPTPTDISASQEPSLRPAPARRLIVIKAVLQFSREGNQTPMTTQEMEGYYNIEFTKWCLTWRTQFRKGGAMTLTSIERAALSTR